MNDEERSERARAAYRALKSAVALDHARGSAGGTPEHLRTGVTVALCHLEAIHKILVEKGIATEDELDSAYHAEIEAELVQYEEHQAAAPRRKVKRK